MVGDCTKVKFASEEDANKHILRIKAKSTRSYVPQRSYQCPICSCWHLTKHLDKRDVRILELETENRLLRQDKAGLEAKIANMVPDDRVKALTTQVGQLTSKCNKQKKEISNLVAENSGLRKRLGI